MGKRHRKRDFVEPPPEYPVLDLGETGWLGDIRAEYGEEILSVFGGIPGERATVEVRRRPRGRVIARVVSLEDSSPHRVDPVCPYFEACTGCQWQHIRYEHQLELKQEYVRRALEVVGCLAEVPVSPVVPSPDIFGYRNHARFTVRRDGSLGFVNRDTRWFQRIEECRLMHPWINETLSCLQERCGETSQLSIRYGINTGEWLIQPTLKSAGVPLDSGQKHYREALLGRGFRIAAGSFFQVNTAQAECMARLIQERISLTGEELLVDAYAGVGTFAALLAPKAGRVIAIEESAAANADARVNIEGLANVELMEAKTEDVLGDLPRVPDVLILDPPRSGCRPEALEALVSRPPRRIVYVSCDPRALARDLNLLCAGPFEVHEVIPMDLFPHTHHVECLSLLVSRQRF